MPRMKARQFSRRDFLRIGAAAGVGAALSGGVWVGNGVAAIPASRGYLLVDLKKCAGCLNCMMACSLVHEGTVNLSLARVQVLQNSFARVPDDLAVAFCRQCVSPACLEACPTGALHADERQGYIRLVRPGRCIGCGSCLRACPYIPARIAWNRSAKRPGKCDLCAAAPFWKKGGAGGRQACVEICPQKALRFTEKIPEQRGDAGYVFPR